MIAVAIGVAALVVMLLVQGYVGGSEADELSELVQSRGTTPAELIAAGAGTRRIVVIGDIRGRSAPKRITQQVLRALAASRGVDALVVEADTALQPIFDRYTATVPEDASILTREPTLLPTGDEGRYWLELYRTVWAVNEELGADRRIRILAVSPGSWPPLKALPPKDAAEQYAGRGVAMADRVTQQMLDRTSRSRVVALVDAMHALRSGSGEVRVGGGGAMEAHWFAATLAERYPVDVYTVLLDASLERSGYPLVAQYAGTRVHEPLRKAIPGDMVGVPATGLIGEYRDPIMVRTGPGISFSLVPSDLTLSDLVDGYIFLPQ